MISPNGRFLSKGVHAPRNRTHLTILSDAPPALYPGPFDRSEWVISSRAFPGLKRPYKKLYFHLKARPQAGLPASCAVNLTSKSLICTTLVLAGDRSTRIVRLISSLHKIRTTSRVLKWHVDGIKREKSWRLELRELAVVAVVGGLLLLQSPSELLLCSWLLGSLGQRFPTPRWATGLSMAHRSYNHPMIRTAKGCLKTSILSGVLKLSMAASSSLTLKRKALI